MQEGLWADKRLDTWVMHALASFATLVVASLLLVLAAPAGPPPWVAATASAEWSLTVDAVGRRVVLESGPYGILVDGDGLEDDGMYAGVYLSVGNRSFDGLYVGWPAPLLVPQRPWVAQSRITVTAEEDVVEVSFEDHGPPPRLGEEPYPLQPPFRMEVEIRLGQPLVVHLRGLYSLLPLGHPTLSLEHDDGTAETYSVPASEATRTTYRDLRSVRFMDAQGSQFWVETDAILVQIESLGSGDDPDRSVFEIDFDHSAKEFGQLSVATTVTLWP